MNRWLGLVWLRIKILFKCDDFALLRPCVVRKNTLTITKIQFHLNRKERGKKTLVNPPISITIPAQDHGDQMKEEKNNFHPLDCLHVNSV